MKNKVVVCGARGFLGSQINRKFINRDWDVIGIDKHITSSWSKSNGLQSFYPITLPSKRLDALLASVKPELLVHAAGTASVSDSISDPKNDYNQNVDVLFFILDAIKRQSPKTKLLFLSSAAVYGNPAELPIHENATLRPISPYGYHKLICEKIIEEYHTIFGVRGCSVRIFSAYGPGLRKQVFWDLCQKISSQNSIRIFGTGEETRDFIHVADIAEGIWIISAKGSFEGEVYNLASGQETKIFDLAENLARLLFRNVRINPDGIARQGFPIRWRANIQKISDLGFRPQVNFLDGVQSYVDWFVSERRKG
jgi:UDP-glucose 4-epimerase